ncbi:hypothetical protein DSM107010_18150 [Chroococcidiopsis cubana SAG 39.79]|uniref:Uncharacterized protein n=1 Tax=Chroococcidiopsis cubana SAG 39.79 TaxID=388085 RepID=A0AB37UNF3_9CYAN|nr:hypothetical protein DSM107010_18150 [Chroococcidiopsis cubana SAG 39.79]
MLGIGWIGCVEFTPVTFTATWVLGIGWIGCVELTTPVSPLEFIRCGGGGMGGTRGAGGG